jgi:hypothetical protein
MQRFLTLPASVTAALCVILLAAACGDDGDTTTADTPEAADDATAPTDDTTAAPDDADADPAEDGEDGDDTDTDTDDTDTDDGGSTDAPSTGTAGGTVTVDGVTYEFTDVTECEVGGETWGPEWRSFIAFDETGHNHVHITHAAAPDDWMTSLDVNIGLANARTLDEGNPDQSWTTGTGGSVAATLTDTGAEGTAEVTNLDVVEGAVDATASWSFSC